MGAPSNAGAKPGCIVAVVRIANVKTRELLRLLRRMGLVQDNRDHANFYHTWLNLRTKVSHGDGEVGAGLMGDIAIKQLKMNSADEFRAALGGNTPAAISTPTRRGTASPWTE